MALFFIHRPVFAWVLAIVTMLIGGWSVFTLPVEQYPDIAPTTIRITSSYSGATARAVQNSVTTPIEDALTGLDGLLYTESSSSTGRSSWWLKAITGWPASSWSSLPTLSRGRLSPMRFVPRCIRPGVERSLR